MPQLGDVEVRPAPRRANHDDPVDPLLDVAGRRERSAAQGSGSRACSGSPRAMLASAEDRASASHPSGAAAGGPPAAGRRAARASSVEVGHGCRSRRSVAEERERRQPLGLDELNPAGAGGGSTSGGSTGPREKPPSVARPTTAISSTVTVAPVGSSSPGRYGLQSDRLRYGVTTIARSTRGGSSRSRRPSSRCGRSARRARRRA